MNRTSLAFLTFLAAAASASAALADSLFEVEHARTTARVGGPVDWRDAELLERWGTVSGTPADWRRRSYVAREPGTEAKRATRHNRRLDVERY